MDLTQQLNTTGGIDDRLDCLDHWIPPRIFYPEAAAWSGAATARFQGSAASFSRGTKSVFESVAFSLDGKRIATASFDNY
jgi:hypothetical protein